MLYLTFKTNGFQDIVRYTLLPNPSSISLYNVESWISLWPFSILDIKLFLVPVLWANWSCVKWASLRASRITSPIANALAFISNSVRFSLPIGPYLLSRCSSKVVISLLIFLLVHCAKLTNNGTFTIYFVDFLWGWIQVLSSLYTKPRL